MGRFIIIPGSPTVPRPKLYPDARLAAGSLMLVDPTYGGAPATGVPAANDRLVNVAQDIARGVIANPAAEVRPQLIYSNWTSDLGLLERSSKGGLHGVIDNPLAITNPKGFYLSLPTALQAYLLANPTHQYLASLIGRVTRVSGETVDSDRPYFSVVGDGSALTSKYFYRLTAGLTRPNGGTLTASRNSPIADATGLFRPQLAINAAVGSPADLGASRVATWGNTAVSYGMSTKPPSWILYSYGLEDLTVSGRTANEAMDAWDAWTTKHVTTAGGRYYGDTWTDPATV